MVKEPIRRSLALGGLGLASLALFAISTKGHEVPELECARLLQATVTTPIESITANRTVFPFGIVCSYESDAETFMVKLFGGSTASRTTTVRPLSLQRLGMPQLPSPQRSWSGCGRAIPYGPTRVEPDLLRKSLLKFCGLPSALPFKTDSLDAHFALSIYPPQMMQLKLFRNFAARLRTANVQSTAPGQTRLRDLWGATWRGKFPIAAGASAVAFAFVAVTVVAPPRPATAKELLAAYNDRHAQSVTVITTAAAEPIFRDSYSAQPGIPQLAHHGTNHDWAKIVLLYGGWPVTENNVTVITRWMRQENGPNNWWNRNNPLNNGWGSGGGGGTGSYPNLLVAAQNAAEALHTHPGYAAIVAAIAADSPTEVTESAIWASPWASGHYANGGHWHYTPVEEFTAPADAWG